MLRYAYFIPLLLLSISSIGQEDKDAPFPEVILPTPIEFIQFPYDSIKALLPPPEKTDSLIEYTPCIVEAYAFDKEDTAYLFESEQEVRLAVRNERGWLITKDRIDYKGFNCGYVLELVNLDNEGRLEILVTSSCSFYKGGRYGNIDSDYGDYLIISIDRQSVLYTDYVYKEEYTSYNGRTIEDGIDEETEIEEMENGLHWSYGRDARYYDIVVNDCRLVADNMDFTIDENYPEYAGLDTLQAVVYAWRGEKLVKQRMVPQFENMAVAYRILRGNAGNRMMTLHLTDFGNGYEGYYYVEGSGNTKMVREIQRKNDTIALQTPDGMVLLKGLLNDSMFSGSWRSGNMDTEFRLVNSRGAGYVPLIPHHYLDSFTSEGGRMYTVDMKFYITDTAFAANHRGFMASHAPYSSGAYFRPVDAFNEFRTNVYSAATRSDNAFQQGNKLFSQEIREVYNDHNIISLDCLLYEYGDSEQYAPTRRLLSYDSRWNTSLEWGNVFTCSGHDSSFRRIMTEAAVQAGLKIGEGHYIRSWLLQYGGLVLQLSGYSEERVHIPKHMIEEFIRDGYKGRF